MILVPITSPRSGLYISPSRLCMADIRKTFREPRLMEYREHPFPADCLQLSSSQTNLSNPSQLLQVLQGLIPEKKRPKSIGICLPDICTRTGIFEFSKIPKNKKEQKSLISWRIEKDLNVSPATARVSYQIFTTRPNQPSGTDAPIYQVLATTIQHSIVEGYEALCLKAGLAPMSIHLASLSVFNLCQTLIDTTSSLIAQKVDLLPDQRILIYIADWGYTVLIFRNNSPAFIRIKPIRASSPNQISFSPAHEEMPGQGMSKSEKSETQAPPMETSDLVPTKQQARTIANELIGTMQYYFETHTCSAQAGSMIPVFLCGSLSPDTVLPEISNIIDKEFPTAGESEEIGIKTFPIAPTNGSLPFKSLYGLTSWTGNTLPAFGAAIAAP